MKLKGEEAFSLEPLQVERMGTVASPIEVFSLVRLRLGAPVYEHSRSHVDTQTCRELISWKCVY